MPFSDTSPRWTQVVEPTQGRFTHHLELHGPDELDEEVRQWLRQAEGGGVRRRAARCQIARSVRRAPQNAESPLE